MGFCFHRSGRILFASGPGAGSRRSDQWPRGGCTGAPWMRDGGPTTPPTLPLIPPPPPQPSAHLTGTSGIRSRVAKRLFLIGGGTTPCYFRSSIHLRQPLEEGPDCGIRFPLAAQFDPPFPLLSPMEDGADSIIRWWLLLSADTSCRRLMAATDKHHTQRL